MNQKIKLILAVILCSVQLFSQNYSVEYYNCTTCNAGNHDNINAVFEYSDNPIKFLTEYVKSDYGPRDTGSDHYDWHGGIDYSSEAGNADFGDGIVCIRDGVVHSLGRNRYIGSQIKTVG